MPIGREPGHPRPRGRHGRRGSAHHRLRGLRHPPEIQAWSTFGNTRGNAIAQLASMVDASIPKNEGFFDCMELRVPEGSCLNPTEGKPVSSGTHHPGVEVSDAIALAMSQIIPIVGSAELQVRQPSSDVGRRGPAYRALVFDHGGEVNAGWVNAVRGQDAWGALAAASGNLIKASAEINEHLFPHILRGRNYITDSGGPGQWRGGCGSNFVKEVRTPTYVNQYVVNQRHIHPGIAGGHHGSADHCLVGDTVVDPSVANKLLQTGEQLVYRFGGGGGWGDPLDRDPAAVLDDVWDEYVSVEGALTDYGVVVTGSLEGMTLAVDLDANQARERVQAVSYRIGIDVGGTFTDWCCAGRTAAACSRRLRPRRTTRATACWPAWPSSLQPRD